MPIKTDLIIVAHGSRREQSNQEVRDLANNMRSLSAQFYNHVDAGFLELAKPSIPEALLQRIASGSTQIDVFPYFLSAGRHVITDVPNEIKTVQDQHPEVTITLKPYLGSFSDLPNMILGHLS